MSKYKAFFLFVFPSLDLKLSASPDVGLSLLVHLVLLPLIGPGGISKYLLFWRFLGLLSIMVTQNQFLTSQC